MNCISSFGSAFLLPNITRKYRIVSSIDDMQKARVKMTKFPSIKKNASAKTKQAIKFFNGKASAISMLEPVDGRHKFQPSKHVRTMNDKVFDFIEDKKVGSFVALAITTAAIIAVAYWGIKQ